MFDYQLKDKVVLITGGATGIGARAVESFLEEGVKHVAFLDILEQEGNKRQITLNAKYGAGRVTYHRCDVTQQEQLLAAFQTVLDGHGSVDVVVNNAGIMNDNRYKTEIELNVTALVTSTFKAFELMRVDQGGKGGVVVNVSSVAAFMTSHTLPAYFATKSFVLQFTNCIGTEEYYAKTGVRAIAVCFSKTDTSLLTVENLRSFDPKEDGALRAVVDSVTSQKAESAARGLVEACRRGGPGSTWLVQADASARDVTPTIREAYNLLNGLVEYKS